MNSAIVDISQIYSGARARQEYGDTSSITQSAKGFMGQIQSLAVCSRDDLNQPYELLAGGRRLKAFHDAGMKQVLVRVYPPNLTPDQKKSIELTENVARLDLSWQEKVSLTKQIHSLQVSIHKGDSEPWTQAMTANLIGAERTTVVKDLQIAAAIELVPDLGQCKTQHEAGNVVAKIREKALIAELARRKISSPTGEGEVNELSHRRTMLSNSYILGDFFEQIKKIPDGTFHLIDLDPPWGIDYKNYGDLNKETSKLLERVRREGFNPVEADYFVHFFARVLKEVYRVAAPNAWIICWYAQHPWAEQVFQALHRLPCMVGTRIPGVWCKTAGMKPGKISAAPDTYLGRTYETFYYFKKGKAVIAKRGRADVFHYPIPTQSERCHPTEKPIALMEDIIETFSWPRTRVFVPFAGSGNTLIAAANLNRAAVGFDTGKEFKDTFTVKVSKWVPPVL